MIGALRAFYWEIKMDIFGTARYKFGVFTDIVVFSVILSVFLLTDSGGSYKKAYNYPNYKEFIVIGYMAWIYAVTAISSIAHIVGGELRAGTFYKKYNSKYPLQLLLFGRLTASLLIESVVTILLLLLVKLGWGVEVTFHPMIIVAVIISTTGMYGIGLVIAGMTIFYKNVRSVIFLIQLGLLFVTDTVPFVEGMLSVSRVFPLTSCNLIIKYILTGQSYFREFIFMCITAAAFLAMGTLCFSYYLKKARKKGNLLFY
jgi:ABC-2 type transport system permease protein